MPGKVSSAARDLSARLLAHESAVNPPAGGLPVLAFRVCDKLRTPLIRLMGTSGFRSLLARAIAVAGRKTRWLQDLKIAPDGSVTCPDETMKALSSQAWAAGEAAATAEFFSLLITFIGRELTIRLLHDIWPKFDETGLSTREML